VTRGYEPSYAEEREQGLGERGGGGEEEAGGRAAAIGEGGGAGDEPSREEGGQEGDKSSRGELRGAGEELSREEGCEAGPAEQSHGGEAKLPVHPTCEEAPPSPESEHTRCAAVDTPSPAGGSLHMDIEQTLCTAPPDPLPVLANGDATGVAPGRFPPLAPNPLYCQDDLVDRPRAMRAPEWMGGADASVVHGDMNQGRGPSPEAGHGPSLQTGHDSADESPEFAPKQPSGVMVRNP